MRCNFGKGSPIVKYMDFLPWAVHKRLNRSIWRLGCGLGWTEGSMSSIVFPRWRQYAQFQSYSPGGANVLDDALPWAVKKTAEPIDLPFGLWTRVDRKSTSSIIFARWSHCVHMGQHIGATWRIRLNRSCAAAMRSYVKLLWHKFYQATLCNRNTSYDSSTRQSVRPRLKSGSDRPTRLKSSRPSLKTCPVGLVQNLILHSNDVTRVNNSCFLPYSWYLTSS